MAYYNTTIIISFVGFKRYSGGKRIPPNGDFFILVSLVWVSSAGRFFFQIHLGSILFYTGGGFFSVCFIIICYTCLFVAGAGKEKVLTSKSFNLFSWVVCEGERVVLFAGSA